MSAAFGLTTQIQNNHIKSALLLAGFPVLLMGMIGGFFTVLGAAAQLSHPQSEGVNWPLAFQSGWAGILEFGQWAVLGAGIWFVIAYFFHDNMMRAATGAVPVTRQQYPKIYNMLENLCISRGMPMPSFEIIDSPALNAFATGLDQKSFKIVLTRGLVEHLPDDELEAVIGHELTHIRNRDVRLLIISVIFVGIISFLLQMVYRLLMNGFRPNYYARRDDREGRGGAVVMMLVALAILLVGYLFAILIRFALSRKREYLADAGSVELTKNPEAMMKALLRISGHDEVPHMPQEMQQMCIENSHNFISLFATHPPVEDRIAAISQMTNTPIPEMLPPAAAPKPTGPWG
jgi:heat shock protein HtpX